MLEKRCTRCGGLNATNANFCSVCGAREFVEVSAEQLPDIPEPQEAVTESDALRLSVTRIVVLSAITSGLYFFFWLYLTWKQLQHETKEDHYPVWHALTLVVPVYGLFRLHKHVRVIQDLTMRVGVETSITAGLAVVLISLNWLLGLASARAEGFAVLFINLIRFALTVTVIIRAQTSLNEYWRSIRGEALRNVPIGTGEMAFVGVIIFIQLSVIF